MKIIQSPLAMFISGVLYAKRTAQNKIGKIGQGAFILLTVFILMGCGKETPGTNSGGGTTPTPVTPTPTTPTPDPTQPTTPAYTPITKVVGVSSAAITVSQNGGVYQMASFKASNPNGFAAQLKADGNVTFTVRNPGTYSSYYFGPSPFIVPQNALNKNPDDVLASDTLGTCFVLEGLNRTTNGCDRAILVLVKNNIQNSGAIGITGEQDPSIVIPLLPGTKQVTALQLFL